MSLSERSASFSAEFEVVGAASDLGRGWAHEWEARGVGGG